MPERWTRAVLRLRVAVAAAWLAVLVLGLLAARGLAPLLANSLAVPGTDSERARTILREDFQEADDGTFTVVFPGRSSPSPEQRRRLERRLARAARAVPTGRPGELRDGSTPFGEVRTTLSLAEAKTYTDELRQALRAPGERPALVTGQPAVQRDLDRIFASDLRRGEVIAVVVALVALVLVLGLSPAVLVPFAVAAGSIAATLGAVFLLAYGVAMVTYVTNLVALIGFALAVDYSLLVVFRFREELSRPWTPAAAGGRSPAPPPPDAAGGRIHRPPRLAVPECTVLRAPGSHPLPATPQERERALIDDAIARTMATAGRAVVVSGLAVALGLGLLIFMPVPLIRSLGVGGLLIPLTSIAAAVTLLPALLSLLGRRGVRRYPVPRRTRGEDEGAWAQLARTVMRRPLLFFTTGTAVLLAAAAPALTLELTPGSISDIPRSPESVRGHEALTASIGRGGITPVQVVVDAANPQAARAAPVRRAVDRLSDLVFHDGETYVVASGPDEPYIDAGGRYTRVIAAGRHEFGEPETRRFVERIRDRFVPAAGFPAAAHVVVGGAPAQGVDFLDRAYGAFPWLVGFLLALTYVVLLRAFRSLLLPLKAVLLNLLSVAAAYGLLVVIFRWDVGAGLLGVRHADAIEGWIPIFLFAAVFGISMDYEVFMVSRIREAWDETADNVRAVAYGLQRTGRVVTAAALIMVGAFSGFAAGDVAGLQQFGVGLALAVLIDATIVRAVLLPSLMTVLGPYNWWLPETIARAVRVAPSPLRR